MPGPERAVRQGGARSAATRPSGRTLGRTWRDDRGAGVIGTVGGLTAFLAFLLLATQLLVSLYATTVVTGATVDGARLAAEAPAGPADLVVRRDVEAHVRDLLGRYGDDARLDWSGTTADVARLRVRIDSPSFVLRALPADLPFDHIDRTAVVRVERWR